MSEGSERILKNKQKLKSESEELNHNNCLSSVLTFSLSYMADCAFLKRFRLPYPLPVSRIHFKIKLIDSPLKVNTDKKRYFVKKETN